MIRVAIVDDELHHRRVIKHNVLELQKDIAEKIEVYEFESGENLLDSLEKDFHIIFLDQIMPPGRSGFETAKGIRKTDKSVVIIFVTAIEDMWEDGYGVQAFYYLTKPIDRNKFERVFKRACEKVEEERRPVAIQTVGGLHVFDIRDILYFKKNQRYTDLHFFSREDKGIEIEKVRNSIKSLETQFAVYDFVRPQLSTIVNPLHIRRITEESQDKYLELVTGEKIFISRERVKSVYEIVLKNLDNRTYVVVP